MGLYKILIVDDEEEIRYGIIRKINWEEYGFEIVGDAENGKDALEKAEKLKPDIIMTDIKMPFMDGLELGEKIKDIMSWTKVIIFSGSDELEYAHKAIKINAYEYVLKPIDSTELIEVLKNLKIKMDKEYDEKKNIEILYKHYKDSLPILKEKFLVGTIEGRIKEGVWKEEGPKIGVDFKNPYYALGVICKDSFMEEKEEDKLDEEDLLDISIKKILDDLMKDYCDYESFIYSGTIIIIGNLEKKEDILKFIKGLNEVCKTAEYIIYKNVSAGVGQVVDEYSKIRFSYKMARNAMHYRMVLGTGRAIYIKDVEPDNSVQLQFDENDERELLNAIKIKSKEEIVSTISKLFIKANELLLPFNLYKIYLIQITTTLLKLVQAYELNIEEVFEVGFNCYSHIDKFDSMDKAKEWFIEKGLKISSLIKRERLDSSKLLIEKAKEYINENYNDSEISVEKLCKHLHVSPTYFSTIFKRETGENFVNYLTTVRLDKAVNLLNTTDFKTYVIAQNVGYPEANYFSYVFKRRFGVSPSKYRNN